MQINRRSIDFCSPKVMFHLFKCHLTGDLQPVSLISVSRGYHFIHSCVTSSVQKVFIILQFSFSMFSIVRQPLDVSHPFLNICHPSSSLSCLAAHCPSILPSIMFKKKKTDQPAFFLRSLHHFPCCSSLCYFRCPDSLSKQIHHLNRQNKCLRTPMQYLFDCLFY